MGDMRTLTRIMRRPIFWLLILVLLLSGCSSETTPSVTETLQVSQPTSTSAPAQPSPTPVPAAAVVNRERIPLAWYENEVARYLAALDASGETIEDEAAARERVLQDIISQVLLAQGAQTNGAVIDDAEIQADIEQLASEVDLDAWMAEWGYSEEDLRISLRLQKMAAYQRELIVGSVPEIVEQANLQQVFAYTEEGAGRALVSLNSGVPFEEVALTYDPVTAGVLGWVPRGYLLIPAVEDAAFSLAVGTYSDIIESEIGYHIVKVLEREERPLSSDARLVLQRQALHNWIEERRENSTIEVLID